MRPSPAFFMSSAKLTRAHWALAAGGLTVILAAACWAYWPSLTGPFIYDDLFFVVQNDAIKDPRRVLDYLVDPNSASEGKRWGTIFRPLRTLSYALDYGGWRLNPVGYHLSSLLAHLVAVTGVFALALRWTRHLTGALLGAAVFALHPLPAEAGFFVGARSDVISVLPVLALTLWALAPGTRTRWRTAGELGLLLIALGCKEATAAAVPCIALALWLRDPAPGAFWRAVRWTIPGVILIGIYGTLRTLALGHGSRYGYLAGGDAFLTWGSALRCRVFELGQIVRPDYLSPSYLGVPVMQGWADTAFWLALLATIGCAWIAWRCRRCAPAVTAGIGWWVLFLLPTSQLIPLNMLMGNRWMYAPFIGLACSLAATLAAAERRWGVIGQRALLSIGAVWVAHCSLQTHARAELWQDPVALWTSSVESWPEDRSNYLALAALHRYEVIRWKDRDPAAAEVARNKAVQAALELNAWTDHSSITALTAGTLLAVDRRAVALRMLEGAYRRVPNAGLELRLWLARVRWGTDRHEEAIAMFDELVAPGYHQAATIDRVRRGEIFYSFHAERGGEMQKTRAMIWMQRAALEFADGRLELADKSVRQAEKAWPESEMATWGRATTLRHAGRPDLAAAAIEEVWPHAQTQPIYVVRAELAEVIGRRALALETLRAAVQRWPFVPELWKKLATAYERQGEFGIARACIARRADVAR